MTESTQTDTPPPTPADTAATTTDRAPLRCVEPTAVHTTSEARLAVEHWLLATVPGGSDRARTEWQTSGLTLLPVGTLFSAVRLPGDLVLAAGCTSWNPQVIDAFLDEALDGGPVICDLTHRRYYTLVPASMPAKWQTAAEEWKPLGVECIGPGWVIGVPGLDITEPNATLYPSYWSVPPSSPAMLCAPLHVARLIAAGSHALGMDAES
ncbi:hypothetical protein ACIQPR_18105 [Streptomyces sp. NPDC091280]|uniref:hypothetical protein n=1 Tax=Streptomyces sp. NPDC091280 TaxID=3365984 RepID=UPI0037F61A89